LSLAAYDRFERGRLRHFERSSREVFDGFTQAVDGLRDRLGPNATARDAIEEFVSSAGS
jgi:hypothetical protein